MATDVFINIPDFGGGGGVSSLNGQTGALTLVAGTNITIVPGSGTLTINSSGGGGSGTVTSVSVVSANGLSGTVATATTTPAITLAPTFTGIAYSTGIALQTAIVSNFPILNQNTTGTASNITATSNSTLTTLNSLSLPYSQVTGAPGGTVTSVALATPGVLYTVSGSPVTSSGTLTLNLISQVANTVFAGPASGSSVAPTFRTLVGQDIPIDNNNIILNGSNQLTVQNMIQSDPESNYFWGFASGSNANSSSFGNVGFGTNALLALTTGDYNIAIGDLCLETVTTGSNNIGIGNSTLKNTTASNNIGLGRSTLASTTTGNDNVGIGYFSLFYNTTGSQNTAVGYQAGYSVSGLLTSSNITLLGYGTGNSGSDGITNSTAIGSGAHVNTSNQIVLGNSSVTLVQTAVPSVLYNSSSPMSNTGDTEYYNSGVQALPIGTSGQLLTVVGGIPAWQSLTVAQLIGTGSIAGYTLVSSGPSTAPTWQPAPATVSQFFASSQVSTDSTAITSASFTTFSNSPAFSFTPSVTGTYKVYVSLPVNVIGTGVAKLRIFNTSGGGTLLEESQGTASVSSAVTVYDQVYVQSVFTLTAGTAYQFDIQGLLSSGTGSVSIVGSSGAQFYIFAELEVGGSSAVFVGSGRSFLTSGTTYTTPVGITSSTRFKFTLVGGGGGGGGINTTNARGSGGGGGGAAIVELTGLSPSTGYTYAIGSGGAGGISTTTPAGAGGSTTLTVGATTYTAAGGNGGADTIDTLGGTGGSTTNATIGVAGQDGMASGAATASAPWGRGGASGMLFGAGGAAIIAAGTGKGGTGYGGGGSGGYGATATGGAGTAGCIIVEWWN